MNTSKNLILLLFLTLSISFYFVESNKTHFIKSKSFLRQTSKVAGNSKKQSNLIQSRKSYMNNLSHELYFAKLISYSCRSTKGYCRSDTECKCLIGFVKNSPNKS